MVTATNAVSKRVTLGDKSATAFMGALIFATATTGALSPVETLARTSTSYGRLVENEAAVGGEFMRPSSTGKPENRGHETLNVATSPAESIRELREQSGLTVDQVGRIFGVSRRSVHNWMNGKKMTSQNEERLAELLSVVRTLPAGTPEERRQMLLSSKNGKSLFHQWVDSAQQDAVLKVSALGPKELLGQ